MDTHEYNRLWDIWCEKYDPENLELQNIEKIVSLAGKDILDVGCGNGRLTRLLAGKAKSVVGIDNDPKMIQDANSQKNLSNITYQLMDAQELSFPDRSFDVIVYGWCLPKDPKKAYHEAKRVLRQGGYFIFVNQDDHSDYEQIVNPFLPENYPKADIEKDCRLPLEAAFGKLNETRHIKIPYIFDSKEQAYEVMKFAIEEWHKVTVADDQKLKDIIATYNMIHEEIFIFWTRL